MASRNGHTLSNFVSDSELDELDDMITVPSKPAVRRRQPTSTSTTTTSGAISKPMAKTSSRPPQAAAQQRARKTKTERVEFQHHDEPVQQAKDTRMHDVTDARGAEDDGFGSSHQNKVLQDQIREAEGNFKALENETARNAKAASDLIESLKAELAEAQKENRTLHNKLSAARSAATNAQHHSDNRANVKPVAAAGSVEAAQLAALKEDLYRDLTGLILRTVKREDEAEVYDCLQTGRNGTLHFKLAIEHGESTTYEDAECHYTPLLDENRDEELIELLPDYLTEEITFPRERSSMFYSRIIGALSRTGGG